MMFQKLRMEDERNNHGRIASRPLEGLNEVLECVRLKMNHEENTYSNIDVIRQI